jgi:hypothetical protein
VAKKLFDDVKVSLRKCLAGDLGKQEDGPGDRSLFTYAPTEDEIKVRYSESTAEVSGIKYPHVSLEVTFVDPTAK